MCEATTIIAAVSLAASAVGGGMQYMAQKQAAAGQASAMNYQAQVNENNAAIQDKLAQDAIERGQNEEMMHRIKIGQVKSGQINAFAQSGVEATSGTALDVLSDTAQIGELESLTIRSNAEREAYGYKVNAMNYRASAGNERAAADNTLATSKWDGLSTAIGTVGSVSSKWYSYNNAGAFNNTGGKYGGGYGTYGANNTRIDWYK